MKKAIYYSLITTALIFSLSSCATLRTNYKYNSNPVYSLEETNVTNGTLETDLEIVGKIHGSAYFDSKKFDYYNRKGFYVLDSNFKLRGNSDQYEEAKAAALYDAISSAGCDIILAPIYKLEVTTAEGHKNYTRYSISIEGFGANIKGIRQIKE